MTELNAAFEDAGKPAPGELMAAIIADKTEEVRALLERGTDPNGEYEYRFPLVTAAGRGNIEAVELLLDKGADIDIQAISHNRPLILAASSGRVDVVRLLIERGAGLDLCGSYGRTALMAAATAGQVKVVRLLIENFVDTTLKNDSGCRAVDMVEYQSDLFAHEGKDHDALDAIVQMLKDAPATQQQIMRDREMHKRIATKQRKFKAKAGNRMAIPGGLQ